jgi:hypothetical protein
MNTSSDAEASARLRGKRVALVVVISVAVAFIAASALQIIPAVFGLQRPQELAVAEGAQPRECAQRIRSLALAVDRASASAWSAHAVGGASSPDDSAPLRAFRHALLPEWGDTASARQVCLQAPGGTDAWATLLRLRSTQEQIILRDYSELLPLRRDFAAHLPTDLR